MAKHKKTSQLVRVVTPAFGGGQSEVIDPLHYEKGDKAGEALSSLLATIMLECMEATEGEEPDDTIGSKLDPLKPEGPQRVQHAWTALDLILYQLQDAIQANDARSAARVALQIGLHTQAGKFAPKLAWAMMAENNASALKRMSVICGTANRKKVLAERDRIKQADPNVQTKKLVSLISRATKLKDSAIYRHLAAEKKKPTPRR